MVLDKQTEDPVFDNEMEVCATIPLKSLDINKDSPPVPSPRKFNTFTKVPTPKTRTKLTPTESKLKPAKEVKSASKLLSHLPQYEQDLDDEDDDEQPSILDVNNDQLFDNSIFTEYDESNLSSLSKKMSKSWRSQMRQERRKTGNFVEAPSISSMVSDLDHVRVVPETPSLSLEEIKVQTDAKNDRRDSSASTFSDWFNTTRDEMILFEKFGENYDEIVVKMSHEEKLKLKEEVSKSTPKDAEELLGLETETTASDSFVMMKKDESIFEPPVDVSEPSFGQEIKVKAMPETPQKLFKTPVSSNKPWAKLNAQTMPSYLRSTAASRLRASPNKNESPTNSCPRIFSKPMTPASRVRARAGIDMKNIVSPVSQYIRANPAPPLMRKIKPKASRFLEEELKVQEDEEEKKTPVVEPQRYFAPLPERQYYSTKVALEQRVAPDVEHKELPKAFGTANTVQAVVSPSFASIFK